MTAIPRLSDELRDGTSTRAFIECLPHVEPPPVAPRVGFLARPPQSDNDPTVPWTRSPGCAWRVPSAGALAGPRGRLGALVGVEDDLADAHRLRGDLDALVLAAELQAL